MSTDKLPLDAGSATRPWVDAFADEMEAKLAANRHKGDRGGWVTMEPFQLLGRLRDEVDELQETLDALERGRCVCREAGCPHALSQDIEHMRVIAECADVANFAMMIADVAGGMEPKEASQ